MTDSYSDTGMNMTLRPIHKQFGRERAVLIHIAFRAIFRMDWQNGTFDRKSSLSVRLKNISN